MAGKPRNRQAAVADAGLAKMNDERERREDTLSKLCATLVVTVAAALSAAPLRAAEAVKIGVLMPLTGNAAAAGQASKAAIEIAAEIVNGKHPELGNLPLAATEGLPNVGAAKIELVFVDHQGNPGARPAIGHASDHPGQGASSAWCLSILVQPHPYCCCGALRHSLPGRRFAGTEHHRARLQMGVPYNPDRE